MDPDVASFIMSSLLKLTGSAVRFKRCASSFLIGYILTTNSRNSIKHGPCHRVFGSTKRGGAQASFELQYPIYGRYYSGEPSQTQRFQTLAGPQNLAKIYYKVEPLSLGRASVSIGLGILCVRNIVRQMEWSSPFAQRIE